MNFTVEDLDAFAVQDSDVRLTKLREVFVIDAPVRVPEEAVALAKTFTWAFPLLLWNSVANATPLTMID